MRNAHETDVVQNTHGVCIPLEVHTFFFNNVTKNNLQLSYK